MDLLTILICRIAKSRVKCEIQYNCKSLNLICNYIETLHDVIANFTGKLGVLRKISNCIPIYVVE